MDLNWVDDDLIESEAETEQSAKRARSLVEGEKYLRFWTEDDGGVLCGECEGRNKSTYHCSVKVARQRLAFYCQCVSREYPCKHALGLLVAVVERVAFHEDAEEGWDTPLKKRKGAKKGAAKKKTASKSLFAEDKAPATRRALSRKIDHQLEGIELAETLIEDLIRSGVANLDRQIAEGYLKQAERLRGLYLTGLLGEVRRIFMLRFQTGLDGGLERPREITPDLLDRIFRQIQRVESLCRRGREYMEAWKADPHVRPGLDSNIAAELGHIWKLAELEDVGLIMDGVKLLQLCYSTINDPARQEYIDTSTWLNLESGEIQQSINYRPYKAAKFAEKGHALDCLCIPNRLYLYPGGMNRRVRWAQADYKLLKPEDHARAFELAALDFTEPLKQAREQFQSPLGVDSPLVYMRFSLIGRLGDGYAVEDSLGNRLPLIDDDGLAESATAKLILFLAAKDLRNQAILARLHRGHEQGAIGCKPLAIVTPTHILRLAR